jgi:hypothetical protein
LTVAGVIGLSDSLLNYSSCDTTTSAAPDDGKIHFDSSTATGFCNFGAISGLSASFDVEYGTGAGSGISGVSGALYHIKFTNFSFKNTSSASFTGDNGFVFQAGSPSDFPDGVTKTLGVILAGSVDDNNGDGLASVSFNVGGGIDVGGASAQIVKTISGSTSPSGSIPFTETLLGSNTYGLKGSYLYAAFYFNAAAGNGFTLPTSFDLIVLGQDYSWNPQIVAVPLPASYWLFATGLSIIGTRLRRTINRA